MHEITILTEEITPRLSYICDVIFDGLLQTKYKIVTERSPEDQILITYGISISTQKVICIPRHGLLEEREINKQAISVSNYEGLPLFFRTSDAKYSDLTFDIFSMCFFLLARYEEYYPMPRDQHDRYQSKFSLAVCEGFIMLPLVDLWIQRIAKMINSKFNTQFALSGKYKSEVTIDIDLPYAFRGKGIKAGAGLLRDLYRKDLLTARARFKYFTSGKDPFDTYSWLKEYCSEKNIDPLFFILNKCELPFDENHIANTKRMSELVKLISEFGEVGVHPSYSANTDVQEIKKELIFLSKSLNLPITKSRQHFLKFTIESTYKSLIDCGISDEYSMGYPDTMGFRASTARPFKFYDLVQERAKNFLIHPCMTMDVTMRDYMNLQPSEAISQCAALVESIKEVNGTFSFIWHNSSLSKAYGWNGWKEVFTSISQL